MRSNRFCLRPKRAASLGENGSLRESLRKIPVLAAASARPQRALTTRISDSTSVSAAPRRRARILMRSSASTTILKSRGAALATASNSAPGAGKRAAAWTSAAKSARNAGGIAPASHCAGEQLAAIRTTSSASRAPTIAPSAARARKYKEAAGRAQPARKEARSTSARGNIINFSSGKYAVVVARRAARSIGEAGRKNKAGAAIWIPISKNPDSVGETLKASSISTVSSSSIENAFCAPAGQSAQSAATIPSPSSSGGGGQSSKNIRRQYSRGDDKIPTRKKKRANKSGSRPPKCAANARNAKSPLSGANSIRSKSRRIGSGISPACSARNKSDSTRTRRARSESERKTPANSSAVAGAKPPPTR